MDDLAAFPHAPAARDRFVLARRGARPRLDPWRHQGVLRESEPSAGGGALSSATVFLTGRECPWRCVMCDLWQHTIDADTPPGALPAQLADAVSTLQREGPLPDQIKLYNASSFFDPRAVPDRDYAAVAALLRPFRRIVVESHPRLVGTRLHRWRDACAAAAAPQPPPALEVAMGLETAHPEALGRLNKRVTLDQFAEAAALIAGAGATLRVFVLVGVPFIAPAEQRSWVQQSVAFAGRHGARVVSLIPTRPGNGTIEALEAAGAMVRPSLADLEDALAAALRAAPQAAASAALVLADTWNLDGLAACEVCRAARLARLHRMNATQQPQTPVHCDACRAREGAA